MAEDQKEKARKLREAEIEDFKFVANDKRGQRVLRRLLEMSGLYRLSFAGELPLTTAFNEGSRNVGLMITNEILEVAPEVLGDIMKGD